MLDNLTLAKHYFSELSETGKNAKKRNFFASLKNYCMFAVRQLHMCAENSVRFLRITTIKRSSSQFILHFQCSMWLSQTEGATPLLFKNNFNLINFY